MSKVGPRHVDIQLTSKCNLDCIYCSHRKSISEHYDNLSLSTWQKIFTKLQAIKVLSVTLSGGEPTLREDFLEIIESVVKSKMRYSLLSNGFGLSEPVVVRMKQLGRVNTVQISLDSNCAKEHDANRGKGSFDKAIEAILRLQKYEVPVTVRVTLTKNNFYKIKEIAQFILKELKIDTMTTNEASYFGKCQANFSQFHFTGSERSQMMQDLIDLEREFSGRITATAGPHADAHKLMKIAQVESGKVGYKEYFEGCRVLSGCGCFTKSLSLCSDGKITLCQMLPSVVLGNILEDDILKVWNCNSTLEQMRKRHRISLDEFSECKVCCFQKYCTGDCLAVGYNETKCLERPSRVNCLKELMKLGVKTPV